MSMAGGQEAPRQSGSEPASGEHQPATRERFWDLKASHWVGVFLTIVLIGVGCLQYSVYSQQYAIMEIDQRPWITTTSIKADWPTNNQKGILFGRIDIHLINLGKSAAYTLLDAAIVVEPEKVWQRQPQICQDVKARAKRGDWGIKWAVFPTANSIYAVLNKYLEGAAGLSYTPWITGCIAYQSTADKNDEVHTTPFAAYLSVEEPGNVVEDAAPNQINAKAVTPPTGKGLIGKSVGATGGD